MKGQRVSGGAEERNKMKEGPLTKAEPSVRANTTNRTILIEVLNQH